MWNGEVSDEMMSPNNIYIVSNCWWPSGNWWENNIAL